MAYSAEQWDRTKALFESGQYSLSEIQEKTGISKSKISEKSKKEQWERGRNADYIEARKTLAVKKGTEKGTTIQVLDDIADEQIRRERLVFGIQEKALAKADTMLDQIDTPADLKTIIDAVDRASITLKVSERHAPKVEVNNTNAQQNNTEIKRVTIARRSDRVE